MATNEETVESDPNFAVICSFYEQFAELCCLPDISFVELQQKLEDTKNVCPELVDLHVRLLRKAGRKSVSHDKWERAVVKYCHTYSKVDAWEIERFGYKKSKLSVKVDLLKHLLESQFDGNVKFKAEINKFSSQQLRVIPIGRDLCGHMYWFQLDKDFNVRIYREDQDDESWELIVKERDELAKLISHLEDPNSEKKKEESGATSENDDSKDSKDSLAGTVIENQKLDTGQEEKKIPLDDCLEKADREVIVTNNTVSAVKDEKVSNEIIVINEANQEDKKPDLNEKPQIKINDEKIGNDGLLEISDEKSKIQEINIKKEVEEDVADKNMKLDTEVKQENETKSIQIRESVIKTVEKVSDLSVKDKEEKIRDFRTSENCFDILDKDIKPGIKLLIKKEKGESKVNEQCSKPSEMLEKINEAKGNDEKVIPIKPDASSESKVYTSSRMDFKVINKETDAASVIKAEMAEKLKSERMIPLKKREIPKEVETEVMSESKLPEPLLNEKKDNFNQNIPFGCLEPPTLACNQVQLTSNNTDPSNNVTLPSIQSSEVLNMSKNKDKKPEQNKQIASIPIIHEQISKNSKVDTKKNDFLHKDSFPAKSQVHDTKKDILQPQESKKDLPHGKSEFSRGSKLSDVLLKLAGKQQTIENDKSVKKVADFSEKSNETSLIADLIKEKCKQNQDEKCIHSFSF